MRSGQRAPERGECRRGKSCRRPGRRRRRTADRGLRTGDRRTCRCRLGGHRPGWSFERRPQRWLKQRLLRAGRRRGLFGGRSGRWWSRRDRQGRVALRCRGRRRHRPGRLRGCGRSRGHGRRRLRLGLRHLGRGSRLNRRGFGCLGCGRHRRGRGLGRGNPLSSRNLGGGAPLHGLGVGQTGRRFRSGCRGRRRFARRPQDHRDGRRAETVVRRRLRDGQHQCQQRQPMQPDRQPEHRSARPRPAPSNERSKRDQRHIRSRCRTADGSQSPGRR